MRGSMRFSLKYAFLTLTLTLSVIQQATISVPRDPQAALALQRAFAAMGGVVPDDSVATGIIRITSGSQTETGTIRILTKGTSESLEQLTTASMSQSIVFSQGQATEQIGSSVKPLYLERAASSQSALFPLMIVGAALSNADTAYQSVGMETLNGASVIHVRIWNTFASQPDWRGITEFTVRDFWFDSQSALPIKLAYIQRETGGNGSPGISVEVFYSNFQNSGGILYPSSAVKWLNGTPWMTTQISAVSYNTGLTDSSFPIAQVTP